MKRSAIDDYAGPMTIGVDVSAYQPDVDWPKVASSPAIFDGKDQGPVRFAIVRSSDGVQTRRESKPDPWAVRHLTGAHAAGLRVAVYHYVRAYHDARAQVELILDVVRTAAVPIGFVALDLEGRPDDPTTPDTDESHGAWWAPDDAEGPVATIDVLTVIATMANELHAEGLRVLIYSGVAWHWALAQHGHTGSGFFVEMPELWTPYFTRAAKPKLPVGPSGEPAPWATWRIWQFAGSESRPGSVEGIRGICDLNRFRGDEAEMEFWWGWSAPSEPSSFDRAEILTLAERAKATDDSAAAAELVEASERLRKS